MRSSNAYRNADRLLDGQLADLVTRLRTEGLSWDGISSRLFADHGLEVTSNTLRRWIKDPADRSARSA